MCVLCMCVSVCDGVVVGVSVCDMGVLWGLGAGAVGHDAADADPPAGTCIAKSQAIAESHVYHDHDSHGQEGRLPHATSPAITLPSSLILSRVC